MGPERDGARMLARFTAPQKIVERIVQLPKPLAERCDELFKEMMPGLRRLVTIRVPGYGPSEQSIEQTRTVAAELKIDVLDWGGNALAIGIPPQGTEVSVDVNALAYVDRGLLGCRYGSSRPHHDIPLMVELYLSGKLMLDELVTEQKPLEGFREIVEDMEAGKLARGVLTF